MSERNESAVGGLLGALFPFYFLIGFAYGELQAWREMGWVSLVNPGTHFYAAWYSVTWPYYVFSGSGDPIIRGTVIGFGVVSNPKETYITNGCKQFSAKDLGWNSETLLTVSTQGNRLLREGWAGDSRMFVLEFKSKEECEFELGRMAGAYAAGTDSYEGLLRVAKSAAR